MKHLKMITSKGLYKNVMNEFVVKSLRMISALIKHGCM